jgi:hypothetical protein
VVLFVSNQAGNAQSLTVLPAGAPAAQPLATTGPINPQGTAQVTVELDTPGDYTVTTNVNGATDAAPSSVIAVRPATLHIGPQRPSGSNDLFQP